MAAPTVNDLVHQFLTQQKGELAPSSHKWYQGYLLPFARKYGAVGARRLTPGMVSKWIATYPDASQHNAARTVVRVLNWAVAARLISHSPLAGFRKPAPTQRERSLTPLQYVACVKAANPSVRLVVKFFHHTGCRPQELRVIEGGHIQGDKIVLPLIHSKGRRKRRTIYLDDMALRIAMRLAAENKRGPIFRNSHGKPWTKNSLGLAFERLRKRTGVPGLCAYIFRHSFITRLIERGVDVATIAAIAGNSPEMVLKVYNHVGQNESRLLSVVRAG